MNCLEYLEISLTEHCNLNCWGCSHFSPLAEPSFIRQDVFQRDIRRISDLFSGNIRCLRLMGGEPLLHPHIDTLLTIARDCCPDTRILLVTNGILLGRMPQSFWNSCIASRIIIHITRYPVDFDYDNAIHAARQRGATVTVSANSSLQEKTFHHLVLDRAGNHDADLNFHQLCTCSTCTNLSNGKLYPCPIAACVEHFNRYFHMEFPITEQDYLDIHREDISARHILSFLKKPVAFCKYCNCSAITHGHKWRRSDRSIAEWTNLEDCHDRA